MSFTVAEALQRTVEKIDRFEAQYLLAHLLGVGRASLIANPDHALDARELSIFESQVAARAKGKPVAYIIGTREFYGREFAVNEHVLIPRPETEIIVEQALARLSSHFWPADRAIAGVLDLGTGSGIIAITLKLEMPACDVTAVEYSRRALEIAKSNAQRLNADVRVLESNWFSALKGQTFDLIVSNPPYVAKGDPHLTQGDLRFEPVTALTDNVDGAQGLACIRHIIEFAPGYLNPGGWLLFEHGYDQADLCRSLLAERGYDEIASTTDLAGIPRVAGARWFGL
jgi:release factor glutamine methyltransferase